MLIGYSAVCRAAETLPVNPHWTGQHCAECHVDGKAPELRYSGNIHDICIRCHERGSAAGAEVHLVNVMLPDGMKNRTPSDWPLQAGKITCLTCHDVKTQMYKNVAREKLDTPFLRGRPAANAADFCFNCHRQELFQKLNPHKQLDRQQGLDKTACLFCHRKPPDPALVQNKSEAALKTEGPGLCLGCHGLQQKAHPGRADHLKKLSGEMKQTVARQATARGIDLPLFDDTIHCVTCHNPHEKGVLQKKTVVAGAGEKYYTRLASGYDLCIVCHDDKKATQSLTAVSYEKNPLKTPPGVVTPHKPWAENRCKACHSITVELREKPELLMLCLKEGCHERKLIDKEYTHEISVLKNCAFCHENHSSEHKKLLKSNEERICFTCHPLLRDHGKPLSINLKEEKKVHSSLVAYSMSTDIGAGNTCFFCHSPEHKAQINTFATGLCADCHITVKNILAQAASGRLTVHDGFKEKRCVACHDPHAGTYAHQLKEPAVSYTK